MNTRISHDREKETTEAKAHWFQSLTINERAALLVTFTVFSLEVKPDIGEKKHAEPVKGRIRFLTKA